MFLRNCQIDFKVLTALLYPTQDKKDEGRDEDDGDPSTDHYSHHLRT